MHQSIKKNSRPNQNQQAQRNKFKATLCLKHTNVPVM